MSPDIADANVQREGLLWWVNSDLRRVAMGEVVIHIVFYAFFGAVVLVVAIVAAPVILIVTMLQRGRPFGATFLGHYRRVLGRVVSALHCTRK